MNTTSTDLLVPQLMIFDVDGTLVESGSDPLGFRESAFDYRVLRGRTLAVIQLHGIGVKTGIATNQGGVAFGHHTEEEMRSATAKLAANLSIDAFEVCFTHPHGNRPEYRVKDDPMRKPGPGMLISLMLRLSSDEPHGVQISPRETLMVGDRLDDVQAAERADCGFIPADMFFGRVMASPNWRIHLDHHLREHHKVFDAKAARVAARFAEE